MQKLFGSTTTSFHRSKSRSSIGGRISGSKSHDAANAESSSGANDGNNEKIFDSGSYGDHPAVQRGAPVTITEPVPTQADITVGTLFTGKALGLDISARTMGKLTAIGVTARGVIPTEGMATGVIRTGVIRTEVMAKGIPMGFMAMGSHPNGSHPNSSHGNGSHPHGSQTARATCNQRIKRVLARHDLAGIAPVSSFGRHTRQHRAEIMMPLW